MSRYHPSNQMQGFVNGLRRARGLGRKAASDGRGYEDNPYKRSEHREEWKLGMAEEKTKRKSKT